MSATLGRVLEDIRSQAGGPGSRMLLSTLGQRLLQQGLDLKADANLRLSEALARYPGFCRVDGHEVLFLDGPAESPDGPLSLPTHPPPAGTTARGLRPDLWKARVSTRPGIRSWMDLDDLSVADALGDAPPDPTTPWRYIEVPSISTDEQADFVRDWLAGRVDDAVIDEIVRAGYRWPREAERLLDPPTWQALRDARREWVVDQTLPWLDEHDIEHRKVVQVRKIGPRTTTSARMTASSHDSTTETLRERVLACVQRMTLQELIELRIPARFLVD